jgi:16S rRNA (guanine527-N7)-methyltransferase
LSDFLSEEMAHFRSQALRFDIDLSPRQLRLLGTYLDELWDWGRRMNLTGVSTRERILTELILDSVVPSAHLPDADRLLDVGTGAGLPGIPLKICRPDMALHLVESNSKKVSFLRHVIRRTGLTQAEVFHGRVEREGLLPAEEGYPVVTARAVAPLARTVAWCARHVANGGLLAAFHGKAAETALREAMDAHGFTVERIVPYRLPGKTDRRHILLLRRINFSGHS